MTPGPSGVRTRRVRSIGPWSPASGEASEAEPDSSKGGTLSLDRLALNALSRLEAEQARHRVEVGARRSKATSPPERLPPGRHRVIVRTAPLTILLCDPLGRILETNAEGVAYTRWSKQALLRTTLHALIRSDRGPAPVTGPDGVRVWHGELGRGDGSHVRVEVLEGRPLGGDGGARPVFLRDAHAGESRLRVPAEKVERLDALSASLMERVELLVAGRAGSAADTVAALRLVREEVARLRELARELTVPGAAAGEAGAETK